jgi:hypothetical protein
VVLSNPDFHADNELVICDEASIAQETPEITRVGIIRRRSPLPIIDLGHGSLPSSSTRASALLGRASQHVTIWTRATMRPENRALNKWVFGDFNGAHGGPEAGVETLLRMPLISQTSSAPLELLNHLGTDKKKPPGTARLLGVL